MKQLLPLLLALLLCSCGNRVTLKGPAVPKVTKPGPETLAVMVPACGFRRLEFIGCGPEGLFAIRSRKDWLKFVKGHKCGTLPQLPVDFNFDKEMIVIVNGCRPSHERVLIREAREVSGKLRVITVKEDGPGVPGEPLCQSDAVALCPSKLPLEEKTLLTAPQ